MNYWIVPWNKSHYNLDAAIAAFGFVDWRQFFNFEVGDIVYIYCTMPTGRLVYEMQVERVHIPLSEIMDDESFYIKKTGWTKEPPKGFVRFRLLEPINKDNEALTYKELVLHGMTKHLQIPIRVKKNLLEYIAANLD